MQSKWSKVSPLRHSSFAQTVALTGLVTLLIALHSSFRRPIWIDEFLVFAVGGLQSFGDLFEVIRATTTTGVNHHQTGIHLTVSYLSLRTFGAELWALRLPSYFATALMFFAVILFFRNLGARFIYQIAAVLAVGSQISLMYYVGEARVYMPLVAAVVGTCCYYLSPPSSRKHPSTQVMGWVSVLLGAAIHPYFLLYWFSLVVFGWLFQCVQSSKSFSIKGFATFVNVPLVSFAGVLYLGLGLATWMRDQPTFNFDIFAATRLHGGLFNSLIKFHLEFLPLGQSVRMIASAILIMVFCLGIAGLWISSLKLFTPMLGPTGLIMVSVADSLFLSLSSALSGFYMYPRQWNASLALVPMGVLWAIFVFTSLLRLKTTTGARIFSAGCLIVVISTGLVRSFNQIEVLAYDSGRWKSWEAEAQNIESPRSIVEPASNEEWTNFGNENLLRGGDVWREVARYYLPNYSQQG